MNHDGLERRYEALRVARNVLTYASSPPPDIVDLLAVAQWVLDGRDPWPTKPPNIKSP